MKAIILAAGEGEALRPITDAISKPMIKILDKPLLQFAIDRLIHNGITEICIVVSKDNTEIKNYFRDGRAFGVSITYAEQMEPEISGAIRAAESFVSNEEQFILLHSDIICSPEILSRTLNAIGSSGVDMAVAVTLQMEVLDFGVIRLDASGFVESIIDEGDEGSSSHYVIAGVFVLSNKIFEYLHKGFGFNQSLNEFIKDGNKIAAGIWNEVWIDIGRPWDLLTASKFLLDQLDHSRISANAYIEDNVDIKGPVIIEAGAEILNGTIIKGPVYVGRDTFIGNNTLIRNHAIISDAAKIGMGCEIKSSIIMKGASIARLSYIGTSIVGPHSTVHSGAITINLPIPKAPIIMEIQGEEVTIPISKFGAVIGPRSQVGVHVSLQPGTIVDTDVVIEPNTSVSGRIKK